MTTQAGDVNGDLLDSTIAGAENATAGKENRQQVINLNTQREREGDAYRYSTQDLGRIEHKIDHTLDRIDDLGRRVQQVEIAIQIDKTPFPKTTSTVERIFMLFVIAAALLTLAVNVYIQMVQ